MSPGPQVGFEGVGLEQLLRQVGMESYLDTLAAAKVTTVDQLRPLGESGLEKIGITAVVHRRKLLRALAPQTGGEAEEGEEEKEKKAHVQNPSSKPCRLWVKDGSCSYGENCKFVHTTKKPQARQKRVAPSATKPASQPQPVPAPTTTMASLLNPHQFTPAYSPTPSVFTGAQPTQPMPGYVDMHQQQMYPGYSEAPPVMQYGYSPMYVPAPQPEPVPSAQWAQDNERLGSELLDVARALKANAEEKSSSGVVRLAAEQHGRRLCPSAKGYIVGSRAFGMDLPDSGTDVVLENWSGSADKLRKELSKSGYTVRVVSQDCLQIEYVTAGGRCEGRLWLHEGESPQRRLSEMIKRRLDICGGAPRAVALALRLISRAGGLAQRASAGGLSGTAAAMLVAAVEGQTVGGEHSSEARAGVLLLEALRVYAHWDWRGRAVMLDAFYTASPLPGAGVSIISPFTATVNLAAEVNPASLAASFNRAATELSAAGSAAIGNLLQCEDVVGPRREARQRRARNAEGQKERQLARFEQATGRTDSDASSSAGASDGQGGSGVILTAPAVGWAAAEEHAKTTDALSAAPAQYRADTF
eukprot:Hpha_TRINITY_DN15166_c4_g10::TRINITY_DN15166_c4_g10_i1::g.130109::m.130109